MFAENLNQFMKFLEMGGYGTYVWSAYGITFLALLGQFMHAIKSCRSVLVKKNSSSCPIKDSKNQPFET